MKLWLPLLKGLTRVVCSISPRRDDKNSRLDAENNSSNGWKLQRVAYTRLKDIHTALNIGSFLACVKTFVIPHGGHQWLKLDWYKKSGQLCVCVCGDVTNSTWVNFSSVLANFYAPLSFTFWVDDDGLIGLTWWIMLSSGKCWKYQHYYLSMHRYRILPPSLYFCKAYFHIVRIGIWGSLMIGHSRAVLCAHRGCAARPAVLL